jgi:hypothetical protein
MKTENDDESKRTKVGLLKILLALGILILLFVGLSTKTETIKQEKLEHNILQAFNSSLVVREISYGTMFFDLEEKEEAHTTIYAWVTGYNSIKFQTDNTPCVGAGGYICGRKQVIACPRSIELGTWVKIDGIYYECLDRMNERLETNFDIFFDKDLQGAINYGKQYKEIKIIK